jgi:phosphoglycerate dehydrogenase-like enzyme
LSRGGIVDETALCALLRDGHLAGAALDVTEQEPPPADSPLWNTPNLLLTPHIAGKSTNTTAAATQIFPENLARYLAQQPLQNLVDKTLGF